MAITIDGSGTITGINAGGLPDGSITADDLATDSVTTAKIEDDAVTAGKLSGKTFVSYAIIADQKAAGTNGGTFTDGSWVTRELNTELTDPDNIVSIATNQFTLTAGSYLIKASAPAYKVNFHQVRLYNVTDTAVAISGYQNYTSSADAIDTKSELSGRITITDTKTFELQHRCSATKSSNGLGNGIDFGEPNFYAVVEIYKEAG